MKPEYFYNNDSLLSMSLKEFVDTTDSSVRLRNSITNAFYKEICPFQTIEEYLMAGESSVHKMLRLKNLGRKTAIELDELIRKEVSDLNLDVNPNPELNSDFLDESEFMWNGIKLDTKCLEQNLYELIQSYPTSVRLRNCFDRFYEEENFPCRTVKDVLINGDKVIWALLRYENFGRNSANELKALVESFLFEQGDHPNKNLSPKGVSELINDFLEQMKPQERKILSCRYGIGEETFLTLEEIGNLQGVTRERIRQIEKKAIGTLIHKSNRKQILDVLSRNQMRIFSSLADANGVVWKKGGPRLPGEYRLALEISHGSFSAWINSISVEFREGWLRADMFTPVFEACQQKIKDTLVVIRLPTPLAFIAEILEEDAELVKLCASLLDGVCLYDGMIFTSRPGRRKQRQAHLYHLLQSSVCQQLEHLVEKHNCIFPSIQCSTRDAQIVMVDAPNLFLSLNDYGWTALGQEISDPLNETNYVVDVPSSVDNEDLETDEECGNLVSAIKRILDEQGPLHFIPLRERFIESFGDVYAQTSVGPVLLTYMEFVRLAPGVYGLKSHLDLGESSKYKEILLSEMDCSLYVLSRWAGEPMHSFPWWNPEMEYAWCKWSQRSSSGNLFSSLIAVSEPNNWMVNNEERQHWLEVKRKNACYSLQFPHKHSLSDCIPSLRELYAVIVITKDQSSMNWIRVNRILGRRVNDHHSATYLAILIALEVLEPTSHWQLPHLPGMRLSELAKTLSKDLCKHRDIPWPTDFGKSLLLEIETANKYLPLGWVERDELGAFVDLVSCGKIRGNDERDHTDCTLQLMLGEKEQDDRKNRFASLIDELMNEGNSGESI